MKEQNVWPCPVCPAKVPPDTLRLAFNHFTIFTKSTLAEALHNIRRNNLSSGLLERRDNMCQRAKQWAGGFYPEEVFQ